VGYTTGGGNDIIARLVAQKFTESWSQQFIVDNRPGAIGIIGSELVARAAPDGYTLGVVSLSPLVFSRFTCAKLGIVAPARTPRAIVEKLHGALLKIATQTDIRERFAALGLEPMTMPSPEAFAAFLKDEIARWSKVAQYAGIKAQ
jgi:tripartite-type tricarboxylate transporter receptor subunit TctC